MEYIIEAKGIEKSFGRLKVLKGVGLTVSRSEVVSIMGASGAGKTTLLQILGTLSTPDAGTLAIDNIDVLRLGSRQLALFRNTRIGFVFQFHHLLPEFTAVENVMIPALISGKSAKKSREEAESLLAELGLSERAGHKPSELSGGEQQRVAIARALLNRPQVIIADEPTGNLDPETADGIMRLLTRINREKGTAIVMVTHNISLVHRYPGRIMVCGNEECVEKKLAPAPSAKTQDTAPQPDENALTENTVPVPENTAGGGEDRIPDSTAKPENKEIQYGENGEDAEAKNGEGGGQENGQ